MSQSRTTQISPYAFLSAEVPPPPGVPKRTGNKTVEGQIHLPSWSSMHLLPVFKEFLLRMRHNRISVGSTKPGDSIAVKYTDPVKSFAKKMLLGDASPPLWSYNLMDKDVPGEVTILGLGSTSPTSPWVPLLDLPNRDASYSLRWSDPVPDIDWKVRRKCICVVVALSPGMIDWEDTLYCPPDPICTNTSTANIFHHIRRLCDEYQSAFALLTDGTRSGMIDNRQHDESLVESEGQEYGWKYELRTTEELPVRMILAYFIVDEAEMLGVFEFPAPESHRLVKGCLAQANPGTDKGSEVTPPAQASPETDESIKFTPPLVMAQASSGTDGCFEATPSAQAIPGTDDGIEGTTSDGKTKLPPTGFRDFDYFALQRDRDLWRKFCDWKDEASKTTEPLQPGEVLTVECDGFCRYRPVIRSPYPKQPVPLDTMDIIKCAERGRNKNLDDLLVPGAMLAFNITKAIRAGPKSFSQMFIGTLNGHELCLKFFDERFFPTPEFSEFYLDPRDFVTFEWGDYLNTIEDNGKDPAFRLWELNFADGMVRREEGIYQDRLKDLQGSLIPHCYGFHYFEMPNGRKVLGLLTEVIHGPSLSQYTLSEHPIATQRNMITRIRHVVRALAYAGIDQNWHPSQIFCPPAANVTEDPNSLENCEIVVTDFAFATQRYGEDSGCPIDINTGRHGPDPGWPLDTGGHGFARNMLLLDHGIDNELLKELWFSLDEEEY